VCANPCRQLIEGEWLCEVIRRTAVQSLDPILDLASRGEHDHRQARLGSPDGVEDLQPIASGEHSVEDHQVDLLVERQSLPLPAIPHRCD
jgi:hypothetical protein